MMNMQMKPSLKTQSEEHTSNQMINEVTLPNGKNGYYRPERPRPGDCDSVISFPSVESRETFDEFARHIADKGQYHLYTINVDRNELLY